MLTRSSYLVLALVLTLFVLTGSVQANTIVFGDVSWDSIQVHSRIAGFILEHGYGHDVDYMFGDTIPVLVGLRRGDVDIYMEIWIDNIEDAYLEALESGEIIDLGTTFPDSPQGWYIPTYLVEGDEERGIEAKTPDLESVFDLPQYWELFKDPEVPDKGRFLNAPSGWVAHSINLDKFEAYGLDDYFNPFDTGSDSALVAAMDTAYRRGEPFVAYYWEPSWVMGMLDLTMLEEPEFDPEVWGENHGCAYPDCRVNIAVNTDFAANHPRLITFLSNYKTTLEQNNEALAYMQEIDGSPGDAALWFLDNYRDVWRGWIIETEIREKVEEALDAELGN